VRLTWAAPANNGSPITDYVIQRSTGGRWSTVRDAVSTARSYTVTGLTNGTKYVFRVAAQNAAGQGGWSATVSATPKSKPAAPRQLQATAGAGRVRLTWAAPASNGSPVTDYVIQRTNGTRWVTVDDGVSTVRSATVAGLTSGRTYGFRVAAKNAVGTGAWSVVVRATPRTH
jgi:hypothetical protein